MNDHEKLSAIKRRIEELYRHALMRPQVLCRPVEIESFVLALEVILDCLDDSATRTDSYRAFLDESNYGATRFESRFEQSNTCRLGFSRVEHGQVSAPRLDDKFSAEFHEHWSKFLEWRSGRNGDKS
jgi:hypothetical protein